MQFGDAAHEGEPQPRAEPSLGVLLLAAKETV